MTRVALALAMLLTAAFGWSAAAQEIKITDDSFKPRILYNAPIDKLKPDSDTTYLIMLAGSVDRATGARTYQLHWTALYSDKEWRRYHGAGLEGGTPLKLASRDAQVQDCFPRLRTCIYAEDLLFTISEPQMQALARKDTQVKLFSQSLHESIYTIRADAAANLMAAMRRK